MEQNLRDREEEAYHSFQLPQRSNKIKTFQYIFYFFHFFLQTCQERIFIHKKEFVLDRVLIFLLTLTASKRTGVSDLNGEQVGRNWKGSAQSFPGDACSCSSVAIVRLTSLRHSEVRHNQGNLTVNLTSYYTPDFLLHFILNDSKLRM